VRESGAYGDEMGRNHRFDDRDVERLLSGKAPNDPSCSDLTEALLELRTAYRRPPSEETARTHVAAMVEEAQNLAATGELSVSAARPSAAGARPSFRRKVMGNRLGRIVVRLSAAALGLSLISGGLVLAGVDLPGLPDQASDEARQALEQAGSQGNGRPEGDVGAAQTPAFLSQLLEYIATTSDEGCVFGQTVAGIASGGKVSAEDPCEKAEAGEAQGSRATGEEASAKGRQTAEDAKTTGAEKSSQGRQTAEDAKSTGAEKSSQGKQTASDAQGSGGQGSGQGNQQTGSDKSQSGKSTAEEKSGGQSNSGGRP
jgi:hypothetical protein